MDFDVATKTSGSRFVFLKGKLALLKEPFQILCLDCHTKRIWLSRNFSTINS